MPSRRRGARLALLVGCCVAGLPGITPDAAAQSVGYTGSLYAVRGDYPTERVNSVYVFNGVDVSGGPVHFTATVPFIRVATTPTASADPTAAPLEGVTAGIGDPLIRVDLRVIGNQSRPLQVGVAGTVKLAVVDAASGLGTGAADYGLGASAFTTVNRTAVMADLLFWKFGDPEGIDVPNTWSYSVGVAQIVGRSGRYSALASVAGFSSGLEGSPPPLALNLGVLTLMGRRQSLAFSASIGLNDSSSDFTIGTSWRIAKEGSRAARIGP